MTIWDMVALVRGAALTDYAELARSVGLDPVRMLRAQGIPLSALTNPDLKIRGAAVGRLLEASAARSGLEDFGLRLARKRRLSNLGAIGLALREQPTMRRAIETMMQLSWLQNESLSLRLEHAGDIAILYCQERGGTSARQATELTLAVIVRTLRTLFGESWRPEMVCFAHAPPRSRESHRRMFNCEVAFDHDFTGVVFASRHLDLRITDADPAMAREIARYIGSLGQPARGSLRDKVLELMCANLASGRCTAERISESLGVDRRTLHRRLAQEGTNFRKLLELARTRLGTAYLRDRRRSLTEISGLLGFGSLSAFSRWHRLKFGSAARRASTAVGSPRRR